METSPSGRFGCYILFSCCYCCVGRYRTLLRECAVWVLQTTATASLCSDPATQRLFLKYNPRSPAFGRFALNTEMDKVFNQLLKNMKVVLKRATKVSLAAGKHELM